MSEMKPWGYIHPEIEKILRDKAASNTCITKKRAGHNTMPLYTAEQLTEAVAAEREKNAKLCDEIASQCGNLIGNVVRSLSQIIRSAAK